MMVALRRASCSKRDIVLMSHGASPSFGPYVSPATCAPQSMGAPSKGTGVAVGVGGTTEDVGPGAGVGVDVEGGWGRAGVKVGGSTVDGTTDGVQSVVSRQGSGAEPLLPNCRRTNATAAPAITHTNRRIYAAVTCCSRR